MAKKTITLVCSVGMSTSLLVIKMQKAVEDRGMGVDIFAVLASEADTSSENKEVNVSLLGPQVRFVKGQLEQKLQPKGIPLGVINIVDYGMINDEKVLDQAISLMGQGIKALRKSEWQIRIVHAIKGFVLYARFIRLVRLPSL